jgi:hypothetical protein
MAVTPTLVRTQVRIVWEPDGLWHSYELPSYKRIATADSRQAAESKAAEYGWKVVNPALKEGE